MNVKADQIAAGARFEINKFGAARCPSLAEKSGVVIRCSPSNSGVTVLFDGTKTPTCLHRDYISPASRSAKTPASR